MTVIVIASTKGGVGKTTTAVTASSGLANFEETVLVDLDVNGQCVIDFGLDMKPGVFNWINGSWPLHECFRTGRPESLKIIPGDSMTKQLYRMYSADALTMLVMERIRSLTAPFVVVDTAAGGLLQEAALMAADQVIVTFTPDGRDIDGLISTLELIKSLNIEPQVLALVTDYEARLSDHRKNLMELFMTMPEELGLHEEYVIHRRAAVKEAVSRQVTIWEYSGSGIKDVRRGYTHLIGRIMARAGYDTESLQVMGA